MCPLVHLQRYSPADLCLASTTKSFSSRLSSCTRVDVDIAQKGEGVTLQSIAEASKVYLRMERYCPETCKRPWACVTGVECYKAAGFSCTKLSWLHRKDVKTVENIRSPECRTPPCEPPIIVTYITFPISKFRQDHGRQRHSKRHT